MLMLHGHNPLVSSCSVGFERADLAKRRVSEEPSVLHTLHAALVKPWACGCLCLYTNVLLLLLFCKRAQQLCIEWHHNRGTQSVGFRRSSVSIWNGAVEESVVSQCSLLRSVGSAFQEFCFLFLPTKKYDTAPPAPNSALSRAMRPRHVMIIFISGPPHEFVILHSALEIGWFQRAVRSTIFVV